LTKGKNNRWTTVWDMQSRLLTITMNCFLRNREGRPRWICVKLIFSLHPQHLRSIKTWIPLLTAQKRSPLLIRKSWLTLVVRAREKAIRKILEKINQPIYNIFWWLPLTSRNHHNIGRFIGFSTNRVLLITATRRLFHMEHLSKGKRSIFGWIK
jgi:hypothetical protein